MMINGFDTKRIHLSASHALIYALIIIFLLSDTQAIRFNEIMYNPIGSDTGREWIEFYSDECNIYLDKYKFYEAGINHGIKSYNNKSMCNYAILCNSCILTFPLTQDIAVYESSFSLSNTGEYLALRLNNTIIDEVNYSAPNSLEGLTLYYELGTWMQSYILNGTPGRVNNLLSENLSPSDYTLNETIYDDALINQNTTNSQIFEDNETSTQFPTLNITESTQTSNIYISIHNESNSTTNPYYIINDTINQNLCKINLSLELKNNSELFINKQQIKFRNRLRNNSHDFKGEYQIDYWIEDLFGNIVKNHLITKNTDEKSFTPNIKEKDQVLIIKNKLVNISCIPDNISKLSDQKMIIVINEAQTNITNIDTAQIKNNTCLVNKHENNTSNLSFDTLLVNDLVFLRAKIYKGDTRKSIVEIYITNSGKKITDTYKIKMPEKHSKLEIDIPLKIKELSNDCNNSILRIEGIEISISEHISTCFPEKKCTPLPLKSLENSKSKMKSSSNETSSKGIYNTGINYNYNNTGLTGKAVYESPNYKNKTYSLYGIIGLCMAGIVYIAKKIYS